MKVTGEKGHTTESWYMRAQNQLFVVPSVRLDDANLGSIGVP